MSRLRLAFMGTPDFAASSLRALIDAGHDVVCVYSQPPRPAGRGHQVQRSPVHVLAEDREIPVRTPKSLRNAEAQAEFAALDLDCAVVAAYGLILPQPVLDAPRMGCLNIHASLLPRWRGAAPIQRAILAGDAETGVTIMQMDAGLDTGAMLLKGSVPITGQTTAGSLHDALADMGSGLIVQALDGLAEGPLTAEPQPNEGVTYAAKLSRDDGRLDWTQPADFIERQVRALNPWPGVCFDLGGADQGAGGRAGAGNAGCCTGDTAGRQSHRRLRGRRRPVDPRAAAGQGACRRRRVPARLQCGCWKRAGGVMNRGN